MFGCLDAIVSFPWPSFTAAVTRDEEEFVIELAHRPEGWLAVGGLLLVGLLCWAVAWMYRSEGRMGASPRARLILALLRCAVVVTLAVMLLEPVRVRILRRWVDSYTIILVDDSSSMDLADRYANASEARRAALAAFNSAGSDRAPGAPIRRASLVSGILTREDRSFLRELAARNRVKFYTFSDEPHLRGTIRATREKPEPRAPQPHDRSRDRNAVPAGAQGAAGGTQSLWGVDDIATDVTARGKATNIERAVRRAVESVGSAPIAAVVVLSDGEFNQGASPEQTARYARDRRIPIHTVGIGDPSRPQNVRVTEILAPPNAFQQDPFSITARLAAEGIAGRTIQVRLRERNATDGGEGRIVETKTVLVRSGGAIEPVVFHRRQERVGRFVYTVSVPVLDGESVDSDNSKQTTVNVIDARTRVLIVAGGPSWEYRFVSRLLERDETFDVSCWLQSADLSAVRDGNTIIDHLPATAEELFEYDVVVLMDPDRREIREPWCRLLDTLVTEYGGGLLYGAARARTPSLMRERSLKPLHDLLPVTLDPEADIVLNEVGHYQLSPSPLKIPSTAYGHPVMQIAADPVSSKLLWQQIGDVYWHYPVLREKPAATVLMRHGHPRMRNRYGGHVLAAVQFIGAGRTAFLGFDSTWRWRRLHVDLFDRFWVQLIRYLAEGKLLGGTKQGMLLTDSDEYSLGEAVTVSARLLDRQYKAIRRDQVPARFQVDGRRGDFVMAARPDRPGWFEGRFVPDRTGSFRISLNMSDVASSGEPLEIAKEIRVTRSNLEILRPQMDRASLMTLAAQSDGGQYFEIDRANELPARIPDLHEEIAIRSRPTKLWDNWKVLALLLTLLTAEWAGRKWNRLL